MFLTKNDFIAARSCQTKLYYKKLGYPSLIDDDPYLEFLRDGGYMVEAMAKLLFTNGRELGHWGEPERAFAETRRVLEAGCGTFFEATVLNNNLLARVDILQRDDTVLRLIEVKSSSFDSIKDGPRPFRGEKGGILSEWREDLEDVTFQTVVLRRAFPEFTIIPTLCLVDKAKRATENVTFDKFRLTRQDGPGSRMKPRVDYIGDVSCLQSEHVLAILDVTPEVAELDADVTSAANELGATLRSDPIHRIVSKIGQKCEGCEYRVMGETGPKNGFRECWGALADAAPHVLDLYRVDSLGGKNRDVVAEMAAAGKARLLEVPDSSLQGAYAQRQRIQIDFTKDSREYTSDKLGQMLASHPYPLHFIDFEVSRVAIPYHVSMRPYELAAFQWSCDTIRTPGAQVDHAEWLNTDEVFPNFEFARKLRDRIGDDGTVYIWSPFEIGVMREIRRQMIDYITTDPVLAAWLDRMTAKGNPRIVDLCALAKDHYFHPMMKNSLSIKEVLPAVWGTNGVLRANPAFAKYVKCDENGSLLDPYAALPPLPIGEKEEAVREGTGAMRVYQEMMFGLAKADAPLRQSYRTLLLQYCELDTKAMVFIWMHWLSGPQA
jgi:uncharacterized protein DUF2779